MSTCPICNNSDVKQPLCKVSFTYNSEFDLVQCFHCGVINVDPIPSSEQFIRFYSTGGYNFNRWRQESRAKYYLKDLQQQGIGGRFLDIGCASAYYIHKISQHPDWEVYGVELSEKPVRFARDELGLKNITHGDLLSTNYADDFFDCININDLLEHVPNPIELLLECQRILKADGIIYLAVPNGYNDSRGLIDYYKKFNKLGCHASGHVYFFQSQTLRYMFEKTGFKIKNSSTIGMKNGLRNIGILPKKRNWTDFYRPRQQLEIPVESTIKLDEIKKHSDLYYNYHFLKHVIFAVPGLHNFGLNFKITLTRK